MAYDKLKNNYEAEDQKMLRFAKNEFSEFENVLNPDRNENNFINALKIFVNKNYKEISTSQLRNVFSKIKNIDQNKYKEIYTIRPKLAYVYGRSNKNGMKKLIMVLDYFIQKVDSKEKLIMFKDFFEAFIAYHKFYDGGKN